MLGYPGWNPARAAADSRRAALATPFLTGATMNRTRLMTLLVLAAAVTAAPAQAFEDELLDRLAGNWVMTGVIGGEQIVHDLRAEWVLNHHYLRFHEVSRERDASGGPAYEAIVFIGWDETRRKYACLWLDVTGGGGLTGEGIGRATRQGDALPFVFDTGDGTVIHNTFTYHRETDSWDWLIEIVREQGRSTFAEVQLNAP
jgi:hypothetical protein